MLRGSFGQIISSSALLKTSYRHAVNSGENVHFIRWAILHDGMLSGITRFIGFDLRGDCG